ncbi:neuronal growth regulator 1 isoform X1 [Dryobates pubescens]|uniref:neuronal growth regulator 1 isoform X1 n=1 Tax=Dryobates pubescens TaxID=118200 RepID=UPI0023B9962B|nr:neuronal growth regulator 1 isoform X1 [Dryobates pubescens]
MVPLVRSSGGSHQWLTIVVLGLCWFLSPGRLAAPGGDFPGATVDNLVVRKGDTAVLRCYLEDGASKGAWLNRSSIIFAGSDKWSVDPRVSIATANRREYSLQIQDVDVTDDGPYTCSVQTSHTPRTMQVHLTVQVSPKIFRISSDIVVNEGSNVTLVCLATGKPEPSISWRHISPSAKPFESGQYLDIYGITRDQAGEYECSAENDVSVPDVKKVKVTVNFAPTIQELKSSGVVLGGNGLIRCEGAGVPAPLFEWYKGERNSQHGPVRNHRRRRDPLLLLVPGVDAVLPHQHILPEEHRSALSVQTHNKTHTHTHTHTQRLLKELSASAAAAWLQSGRVVLKAAWDLLPRGALGMVAFCRIAPSCKYCHSPPSVCFGGACCWFEVFFLSTMLVF